MITKLPKMSLADYSSQIKIDYDDCKTAAVLLLRIGKSLEKIHRKRLIHRDVCMENIAVRTVKNDVTNTVMLKELQIAGWDFAFYFNKDSYEVIQTFQIEGKTLAPEVMAGAAHGPATDVWGLGKIAVQLLAIVNCPDEHVMQDLVRSMIDDDKDARPTMEQVVTTLEEIITEL